MTQRTRTDLVYVAAVGAFFLVPAAHPLLRPMVGVPSHLLWFAHVLPVALLTFRFGRVAVLLTLPLSALLVSLGERMFGAGYGSSADLETVGALTLAVLFTDFLVSSFALYARQVAVRERLLFDRVRMGVLRLDGEERVARANPAAAEILGVEDPADLAGLRFSELVRSSSFRSAEELEELGSWTGRVEAGVDPGSSRALHALLLAIRNPSAPGHQVLISDRSLELLQEQEIERQSKLAALGEALAGVAHELNNPLAAIIGHAQLGLLGADGDGETLEFFEVIDQQAQRMKTLVAELLGFSRRSDEEGCVLIHELLGRLVRVERIALGSGVTLTEDLRWQGEIRVSATKIEQIVLNLVSNAAHAVRSSGGGTVTVSCRRRDDRLEIGVRDDGPGIAPEVADSLFQPFTTTKPEGEGTGLGLAISRRLARSWGGDLVAENLPRGGASFVLTFPLALCSVEAGNRRETVGVP